MSSFTLANASAVASERVTARTARRLARRAPRVIASHARARRELDDDDGPAQLSRRASLVAITAAVVATRAPSAANADEASPVECYFDIAVDAEVLGRVIIAVDDSTLAGARFAQLCRGVDGLSYRRTTIESIEVSEDDGGEIYLRNGGVNAFVTPGTQAAVDIIGGPSAERLVKDLGRRPHDVPGLVSVFVQRDPSEPEPEAKARLVSVRGKFETVYDAPPPPPNGTAFAITLRPAPELEATNVVVGRVVDGWDVLEAISKLPTVKDNSNSPFFQVAKSIGDKRATVAEQAFSKPFKKVVFQSAGVVARAPPPPPPPTSDESTDAEPVE